MIKLENTDNLHKNKQIDIIYTELAKKVLKEIQNNNDQIECKYQDKNIKLDNELKIKEFLLSKDFYNYRFKPDFISDFYALNSSIKLKSILGINNSEATKDFIKKYKNTDKYGYLKNAVSSKKYNSDDELSNVRNKICKDLYGYENTLKKYFQYKLLDTKLNKITYRTIILNIIDLKVCPYCNMNYTIKYKNRTMADLDHFYIQSIYPEYALCLYNFIPSCSVCNRKLKLSRNMTKETHIYPHEDSFEGKARFEIDNIVNTQVNGEDLKLKLNIYNDDQNKVFNSEKAFKLDEAYNNFTDYVKDLLDKAIIYNNDYNESINTLIKEILDIKTLIFGKELTEEDLCKTSLGKLKRDILKQLGIY